MGRIAMGWLFSTRGRAWVAAGLVAWVLVAQPASAAAAGWILPVDRPISDPFRPPATRFSAGNRGIEFRTEAGDPVVAVASGRVSFAGTVGRDRHVTVDHGSGLRSTYAYLEQILVVRGQSVGVGEHLGTARPGFHLTARLDDTYVDPALLFAGAEVVISLVDGASPSPSTAPGPVRRGPFDHLAAIAANINLGGVPVGVLGPMTTLTRSAFHATRAWADQDCDDTPGSAVPTIVGSGRVLIQVAGLGSSSEDAAIGGLNTAALGYDPADVIGFSYAGGCIPVPFGHPAPDQRAGAEGGTPYGPTDTYNDLEVSATRLADLIESVARANPGRPIDIAAHSLGGVVTRRALEILDGRAGAVLPATVVTIGSPHAGVPLADLALAVPPGGPVDAFIGRIGDLDALRRADSVAQVATAGLAALAPPTAPPEGVRVVSIGASTDLVVPGGSTRWEGAGQVIVDTRLTDAAETHGGLPALEAVAEEFRRAVSGLKPQCASLATMLASTLEIDAITRGEEMAVRSLGVVSLLSNLHRIR